MTIKIHIQLYGELPNYLNIPVHGEPLYSLKTKSLRVVYLIARVYGNFTDTHSY